MNFVWWFKWELNSTESIWKSIQLVCLKHEKVHFQFTNILCILCIGRSWDSFNEAHQCEWYIQKLYYWSYNLSLRIWQKYSFRFIRLHEQLNNIQEMILALEEPTIDGTNRSQNKSTGRENKLLGMQCFYSKWNM